MVANRLSDNRTIKLLPLVNYGQLGLLALAFILSVVICGDSLWYMVEKWQRDEYSHGYMIPVVALFLVWQKQEMVAKYASQTSWWSVALLALALFIYLVGELSSIYTLIQYAFLMALYAVVLAFIGWRAMGVIWMALAYLVFMIPLPNFLYNNLSSELQLLSSTLGVAVIRLFDISVYLEGNVIDLGNFRLQVVEACSGLRYLFPLMSFGFLVACLYRAPIWQRVFLFFSTIPITILMNSFRIGVIGVTVEYWGIEAAEGFLHDFEGWFIFIVSLAILVFEMWLFWRFRREGSTFTDCLDLSVPGLSQIKYATEKKSWHDNKPLLACVALLLAFAVYSSTLVERQEHVPLRTGFVQFPLMHEGWIGREDSIAPKVLSNLQLSDYFIANYRQGGDASSINIYMAYYASQRKGASVHSPRSCIPGGGWQIKALSQQLLQYSLTAPGETLSVNRLIIQKGNVRQLVYYWFQQRERVITNEYTAKWFIFWDALTKNRTDGALIRVTSVVADGVDISKVDRHLQKFILDFLPLLPTYIPSK